MVGVAAGVVVALALAEGALRWLNLAEPPTFRRDPEHGYLMSPQHSVSTRGHQLSINRAGLRGRAIDRPKRSAALRMAFVGELDQVRRRVHPAGGFVCRAGSEVGGQPYR